MSTLWDSGENPLAAEDGAFSLETTRPVHFGTLQAELHAEVPLAPLVAVAGPDGQTRVFSASPATPEALTAVLEAHEGKPALDPLYRSAITKAYDGQPLDADETAALLRVVAGRLNLASLLD
jgi:hypothetical protein